MSQFNKTNVGGKKLITIEFCAVQRDNLVWDKVRCVLINCRGCGDFNRNMSLERSTFKYSIGKNFLENYDKKNVLESSV